MDFSDFGDLSPIIVAVLVFAAAASLTFGVMALMRAQGTIRRRAAGVAAMPSGEMAVRPLRGNGMKAATNRVLDYTQKHYATGNNEQVKVLRKRMMQAGIYDPRAVGFFFLARTVLAVVLAGLAFVLAPVPAGPSLWLFSMVGGIAGYIGPSFYIDRRIKQRQLEHQSGFPDFMDLLVVCADAGLSMEAGLDRVASELADSYPSLATNLHMTNLEIRAGKTMTDALEHLGDRLGLDEARSFATLIQQSEELGSSITDALRVYSDDMRHKRLSRAEEKAYSLPARLSLPMMICIFPVLFVVILLPVIVRMYVGNWN